jgi:hypothetical protein
MRKEREVSAPPSALPRPPRIIKSSKKPEFEIGGRLSETESNKSSLGKPESEKNLNMKHHQSPSDFSSPQNTLRKNYGSIKNSDSNSNLTSIYYTNKPNYISTKNYQRLPESPRHLANNNSNSSLQRFGANTIGSKSMQFVKSSGQNQFLMNDSTKAWKIDREGSSSSNFNSKPEISTVRSRTQTPPKFLNLNSRDKISSSGSQSSPTKASLPSASVLYQRAQSQTGEWKQRNTNGSPKRDGSSENRYRIQF